MLVHLCRIAMLCALMGCASSTRSEATDPNAIGEDSGALSGDDSGALRGEDASAPVTDAGEVECGITEGDFSSDDPQFGRAFWQAKGACDSRHGWACGDFMLELDADGCVVDATSGALEVSRGSIWLECLVNQVAGTCSQCEQSEIRRFYESCTIL